MVTLHLHLIEACLWLVEETEYALRRMVVFLESLPWWVKSYPLFQQSEYKIGCFNKKIVILCGCFCDENCGYSSPNKLHVISFESKSWIKKEIVLEHDLNEADFHKIPKQ